MRSRIEIQDAKVTGGLLRLSALTPDRYHDREIDPADYRFGFTFTPA